MRFVDFGVFRTYHNGPRRGGGIGRRAWLRAMWEQSRAGSNPAPGTNPMETSLKSLIQAFHQGQVRALAKLITVVENGNRARETVLKEIFPKTGHAHRIGITGPPGAGKSTIVDHLALALTERGHRVAILAVDPTSPFTGGALLGDRHRMVRASQQGVFIRSLATRGSLGGLSEATPFVADLLDAFGFDVILIETVGVGQSELDIITASDTVVVVLVPESGDSIQAMKAGLMEIADIFVINKYDREGSQRFRNELESILGRMPQKNDWVIPILPMVAIRGEGIPDLAEQIKRHWQYLHDSGKFTEKRRQRILDEIERTAKDRLWRRIERQIGSFIEQQGLDQILQGKADPYTFVEELIRKVEEERDQR